MSIKALLVLLFIAISPVAKSFYFVEEVRSGQFLIVDGQTYEKSPSCSSKFASEGDELLFISISASSAHCDHVIAKNLDNGLFCQLFCQ